MIPPPRSPLRAAPLLAALAATAGLAPAVASAQVPEARPPEVETLHALFDDYFEWTVRENPLFATGLGRTEADSLMPDPSEAAELRRLDSLRVYLARADSVDGTALPRDEQIDLDIFRRVVGEGIREIEVGGWLMPFTTFVPFYGSLPDLADRMPLDDVEGYEAYVARLEKVDDLMDAYVEVMRTGLERGITLPRVIVEGVGAELEPHLVDDPGESRFWAPFEDFPDAVPEAERERLREAGRRAVTGSVVPGYRTFHRFVTGEYVPRTRASIGISEVPGGRDLYRHRVRRFTTLDVTPDEVHERGLSEVRRIRSEMEAVMEETGFEGGFAAFLEFLRTDPRFYPETPEELLEKTALVLKRMDGELPKLFGTLPRTPYGIRPIPDYMAPRMTTAYYSGPSPDGTRAGFYYVNTYDLPSRPLYEIEALSFHEAVPGHHLQNALAMEQGEVPDFRRFVSFTAFGEGWGLYSERLGLEVGFYEDPYSDFGRLSYEMWRALRLVVDTGIHWKGWSRRRAIDFMAENSALSLRNIESEVDRYISWPGQALGYKMGELAIRDLRSRAEERLGADFDLRAFHDVVLGSGEVPLDVLEENVERWMETVEAGDG